MTLRQDRPGLWLEEQLDPPEGDLRGLWSRSGTSVAIGVLTDGEGELVVPLLDDILACAIPHFAGLRIALCVVDATYTAATLDAGTLEAAVGWGRDAASRLYASERSQIQIVVTTKEGYAGDCSSGRATSLCLLLDEMSPPAAVGLLVLCDPRRAGPVAPWLAAASRAARHHPFRFPQRPFLVLPEAACAVDRLEGEGPRDLALCSRVAARERDLLWKEESGRSSPERAILERSLADSRTVIYGADGEPVSAL
jgi:hypothetical protein